jgi:hypothetical protein
MTDRPTDRLWPIDAIAPERRAQLRAAFAADPTWLDRAVSASLVGGEDTVAEMQGLLRRMRCSES